MEFHVLGIISRPILQAFRPHEKAFGICDMAPPNWVAAFLDVRVEPLALGLGRLLASPFA